MKSFIALIGFLATVSGVKSSQSTVWGEQQADHLFIKAVSLPSASDEPMEETFTFPEEPNEAPVVINGILYLKSWDTSNATIVDGGIGKPSAKIKVTVEPRRSARATLVFYYSYDTKSIGPLMLKDFYENIVEFS